MKKLKFDSKYFFAFGLLITIVCVILAAIYPEPDFGWRLARNIILTVFMVWNTIGFTINFFEMPLFEKKEKKEADKPAVAKVDAPVKLAFEPEIVVSPAIAPALDMANAVDSAIEANNEQIVATTPAKLAKPAEPMEPLMPMEDIVKVVEAERASKPAVTDEDNTSAK